MHLLGEVCFARRIAIQTQQRIVMVVPPKAMNDILPLFTCQASKGDLLGGRSIFFKDGGQLVLCSADGPPEEVVPFMAVFVAWDGKVGQDARPCMTPWRQAANSVIRANA